MRGFLFQPLTCINPGSRRPGESTIRKVIEDGSQFHLFLAGASGLALGAFALAWDLSVF